MSIIRKVVIQYRNDKGVIKDWKVDADIEETEADFRKKLKEAASGCKFVGYYWEPDPTAEKTK